MLRSFAFSVRGVMSLFALALGLVCTGGAAHASSEIDGYVGPRVDFVMGDGSRIRYNAEFGRISKVVQLDAFMGTGGGYKDYGFNLKLFNYWQLFGGRMGSTGIMAGAGLGASYIPDLDETTTIKEKYWDLLVTPYLKALYDTGLGFGAALDLAYELIPLRSTASGKPVRDTSLKTRFIVGLGVVFDF
jgi:hypothetical protein